MDFLAAEGQKRRKLDLSKVQPFLVNQTRVDAATKVLSDKWRVLTDEQRLMVMIELGDRFYDQTTYDSEGDLNFIGTDLQVVAAAAAFAAVVEAGGYVQLNG